MNSEHLPLILIEGILIGGGALLFGWWQLRSVRRDREKAAADRASRAAAERDGLQEGVGGGPSAPPQPPGSH